MRDHNVYDKLLFCGCLYIACNIIQYDIYNNYIYILRLYIYIILSYYLLSILFKVFMHFKNYDHKIPLLQKMTTHNVQ